METLHLRLSLTVMVHAVVNAETRGSDSMAWTSPANSRHQSCKREVVWNHAQIFKKVGGSAMRLLFIPGVVEAFFDGGIAIPIFGMPPAFAFALGFILKARCFNSPLTLHHTRRMEKSM